MMPRLSNLSLCFTALDEVSKAKHFAELAAEADPESWTVLYALGCALQAEGDFQGAETAFRSALENQDISRIKSPIPFAGLPEATY